MKNTTPLPLTIAIEALHLAQDQVEAVYLERWATLWHAATWRPRFWLAVRRRDEAAYRVGLLIRLFA